jgi:hypothetical protein
MTLRWASFIIQSNLCQGDLPLWLESSEVASPIDQRFNGTITLAKTVECWSELCIRIIFYLIGKECIVLDSTLSQKRVSVTLTLQYCSLNQSLPPCCSAGDPNLHSTAGATLHVSAEEFAKESLSTDEISDSYRF